MNTSLLALNSAKLCQKIVEIGTELDKQQYALRELADELPGSRQVDRADSIENLFRSLNNILADWLKTARSSVSRSD